jgi:hypothetical protein
MSLELGIQSRNELVLEMATEMSLKRMGEDDKEDDDNEGDVVEDTAAAATPEVVAKEEEDSEMLIPE